MVEIPKGEDFAVLATPEAEWPKLGENARALRSQFKGYILDPAGVPTFRYLTSSAEVEDRLEVVGNITKGNEGFLRTIALRATPASETMFFRLIDGLGSVTPQSPGTFRTEKNVTVSIEPADQAFVRGTPSLSRSNSRTDGRNFPSAIPGSKCFASYSRSCSMHRPLLHLPCFFWLSAREPRRRQFRAKTNSIRSQKSRCPRTRSSSREASTCSLTTG